MRKAFWARTVRCAAHVPKEALMRIPALAILTLATVLTAAPARAQTYDPAYPVCLHVYNRIHILRARKSPRVIGGVAASTKCLAGRSSGIIL